MLMNNELSVAASVAAGWMALEGGDNMKRHKSGTVNQVLKKEN